MPYKLDTDEAVYLSDTAYAPLANCSAFRVLWRGVDFDTATHAYQWEKFYEVAEGEPSFPIQSAIQYAGSTDAARKLAEVHAHLRHPEWNHLKVDRMRAILEAKTAQHTYVQHTLLATGTSRIIHDAAQDVYWGWGPNKDGRNILGALWMAIRRDLRGETPPHA
jgi:ribA/ribD-fused uncharacterized protein